MKRLRNATVEQRFWQKVKTGDACWEWQAYRSPKGYGILNHCGKARSTHAHRISWEIHNGQIPDGLHVLHKCDNPPCVNPDHLFLGTNDDNVKDCKMKGRHARLGGERNPRSKLTVEEVKTLRHLYWAERRSRKELAEFFGICQSNAWFITNRRTWTHV